MIEKEEDNYSRCFKDFIFSYNNPPTLNLGCGVVKIPNAVNVDYNDNVKPDVKHDLNDFPYPFDDESFNTIYLLAILEHLKEPQKVIDECHRILKVNGRLIVLVPSQMAMYFYLNDRSLHKGIHLHQFYPEDLKILLSEFDTKIFGYRGDNNRHEIPGWLGRLLGKFIGNLWICVARKV